MRNFFSIGGLAALLFSCVSLNSQIQDIEIFDGTLAFVSIRNGNAHIFTTHGLGTDQSLTSGESINLQPVWSPNGQQIAFTSNRDDGLSKIFLMENDGSNQRRLTSSSRIETAPSWSPNGKFLAFFSREITGEIELHIVDVATNDVISVKGNELDKGPEAPTWSGDSSLVAFMGINENNINEVWVVKRDGSEPRIISAQASNRNKAHPDFSPLENKIAYIADMKSTKAVMVTDIDNDQTTNLTEGVFAAHEHPRWSQDGKQILFASSRDDEMKTRMDIFLMNANGSDVRNLSQHPHENFDPRWSANGRHIVFASLRTGTSQLFALDVISGQTFRLTENASHDMEHAVRPTAN